MQTPQREAYRMLDSIQKKKNHVNLYQSVFDKQQQLIMQLVRRNQFLNLERQIMLKQNISLRKEIIKLKQMNQAKVEEVICPKCQGKSSSISVNFNQQSVLFEQFFKQEENQPIQIDLNSVTDRKNTQNDLLFFISASKGSYPRQAANEESLFKKTPILYEPQYTFKHFRCKAHIRGFLRAFYIKLILHARYSKKIIQMIKDEYQNGLEDKYLFNKYPDNIFIGNLLIQFLERVKDNKRQVQIIQIINQYKLYDDLLCTFLLNYLITYGVNQKELDTIVIRESCFALANAFDFEHIYQDNSFKFYEKNDRNNETNRVYEQISLNPGTRRDNCSQTEQESQTLLFEIHFDEDMNGFTFAVRQQQSIYEEVAYYSQYKVDKNLRQFDSESSHKLSGLNVKNHFIDVPSIMSSEPQSISKEQKNEQNQNSEASSYADFQRAAQNYFKHKQLLQQSRKSSMLLSSYNSQKPQQPINYYPFKISKKNMKKVYSKGNSQSNHDKVTSTVYRFQKTECQDFDPGLSSFQ